MKRQRNSKIDTTPVTEIELIRDRVIGYLSTFAMGLSNELYWKAENSLKTNQLLALDQDVTNVVRHISIISDHIRGLASLLPGDSSLRDEILMALPILGTSCRPDSSYYVRDQFISDVQIKDLENLL